MPILKQLVSGSHTKRRSRMDLTREMISAPLGDFRHTMHVGRSGDAFGDTSFLSSRSGEPPGAASYPSSPRPSLLSRTFKSSKRSQSVTRVDQQQDNGLMAPDGSPTYVKNAMSLPFLNDGDRAEGIVGKSLPSSPLGQQEVDGRGAAAAAASHFLELEEQRFGELTELPESSHHYGGGLKHAESVMSFHLDLGPSMLGDILGVMEKEDDDLGYEEGKSSEGRASPPLSAHGEDEDGADRDDDDDDDEEHAEAAGEPAALQEKTCTPPGSSVDLGSESGGPYTPEDTPETRPRRMQQLDSCSMSSSGSAVLEDKPSQTYAGDTDSATFSAPPEEESNFSSFLEDEDDEIRV